MMLKVQELELSHLDFFDCDDEKVMDDMEFCLDYPQFRQAFSIMTETGKIVAILGASLISNGVWEGWLYTCKDIQKYSKSIVREAKQFSDWAMPYWNIHRLQIAVTEENKKWAQAIGFQFEGTVKNYHRNVDHYMFTKVRDYGC